jgi:hypothetical protein
MLYENGIMDDISYHIYLNWFDELSMNLKTDRIVYVKTRPETAVSYKVTHTTTQVIFYMIEQI